LSAQAAGGVHLLILGAFAAWVVFSGLVAPPPRATQSGSDVSDASWRQYVGTSVWFGLAVFCLAQALPLPLAWVQSLASDNADIWARALKPFGLPAPEWASISLAPRRTLVEALKFACYGVVFGVSAALSRQWGVRSVALLVYASALAVALASVMHQLVGAELLYGVYRPLDVSKVAPLLNDNNRAGYLNLGFFCGLGLLFHFGRRPRGALIGMGLVFLVSVILLCQSRGGTASLIVGLLLVLLLRRKKPGSAGQGELGGPWQAAIVASIAAAGTLMVLSARRRGGLGFQDQSLEKLELIQKSFELARDHLGVGVGRGAFGSVFSAYQSPGWPRVYEHAENFPLQWAAEWGLPITLLAGAALVWSLAPAFRQRSLENPVRRCALVGCLVLLGQNLVDLGLEIPALGAAWAALLGALSSPSRPSRDQPAPSPSEPRWSVPSSTRLLRAGSLLTLGCLILALTLGSDSPARERDRLHAQLAQAEGGAPSADFWQALRQAVEAYPADPYFPLLGSAAALAAHQNALPWVARALERGPASGTAHVHLARTLQRRGATPQAFGALRRAALLDPAQVDTAVQLALRWDAARVDDMVPDGLAGAGVLRALADRSSDPVRRLLWLEQSLEREPDDREAHYRVAVELFQDLRKQAAGLVCAQRREACIGAVLRHASRAERSDSPRVAMLRAQLLEWQEDAVKAETELASVCGRFPGDSSCAQELAVLAIKNKSARVPAAVNAWVALACATRSSCGQAHLQLGGQFAAVGQWHSAVNHYRQATQETPTPHSWRALAQASRQIGQEGRASDALRRADLLDLGKSSSP
jgi:tetratricopeptide (TPR) repeat protein